MFIDPQTALERTDIQQLAEIALTEFSPRRKYYRDNNLMAKENIERIYDIGMLNLMTPIEYGGHGSNLFSNNPSLYLQAIRVIARGCSSTAHSFQVHNHSTWTLAALGTDDQKQRYLHNDSATLIGVVASEPERKEMYKFNTSYMHTDDGVIVNGVKSYATNALMPRCTVIFASDPDTQQTQLLIIDPGQDGVTIDDNWYTPAGMRATRSPLMKFENVFVPTRNILAKPGDYVKTKLQAQFHLGFAANYLGTIEGMYNWFLQYINDRSKASDQFIQMRVGEMEMSLNAAQSLFHDAIRSWQNKSQEQAEVNSIAAKSFIAKTAMDVSQSIVKLAGSHSMFDVNPLSIYLADLQTHITHSGHDKSAQIIGQNKLGEKFDTTLQR